MCVKMFTTLWVLGVFIWVEIFVEAKKALPKIKVHPEDQWFMDNHNRVRFFHGVNSVEKGFPWYPPYLLNTSRLDDLKQFGFNIVRLGTMWSGVEPEEGVYNSTYIEITKQIVENLAERGIYAMLDMHQDCLSSRYPPSYDGVPLWLIDGLPPAPNPYPWPLEGIDQWEEGYLTQAVSRSFQHIYNNTNNSLEKWADFWEHVTLSFKDYPSVIGYNLINEPWVGDYLDHDELILPGVAGAVNLLPVYDVINERIRRHDAESIVFYEPVFYGQLLHDELLGSGFGRVPGGPDYRNVSAFSYHTYCWPLEFIPPDATDAEREEARRECRDWVLPTKFRTARENANLTGGGSILTEFGLCKTSGDRVDIECDVFLSLADKYLQSWIDWDYNDRKWYTPDGQRILSKIKPYVRPYAQAVAGIPQSMEFTPEALNFTMVYKLDPSIDAPTEIYIPSMQYTNGFFAMVTPPMKSRVNIREQMLYVYYEDGQLPSDNNVIVQVLSL